MRIAWLAWVLCLGCDKHESTATPTAPEPASSSVAAPSAAGSSASPVVVATQSAPPVASTASSPPAAISPKAVTSAPAPAASSAPAPAAPAAPGVGMHFDGSHFTVDVPTPAACPAGAACELEVRLTATGEFHVNKDYPYKLKFDDAPGAVFLGSDSASPSTFSKSAGDFKIDGEKLGVMKARLKGTQAGAVALSGTLKLSVCNASNCQLEQAQIKATVPFQ